MNNQKIKQIAILSVIVSIVQFITSQYIYPLFNLVSVRLFSITPYTALTSATLGNRVLGFLTGIIPVTLPFGSWIAIFIGAFILLTLGYWIIDQREFRVWRGKNKQQRLWLALFYGTIGLYAFLYITNLASIQRPSITSLLLGVALNYAIVGSITSLISNYLHKTIKL